jgi:MoaA/NifB/PqqE/SkfB family radical SAM enzyme
MMRVIAVISMLHEGAEQNSGTRRFRDLPVLDWTLRRLSGATSLESATIFCWDDQLAAVNRVAESPRRGAGTGVITKGVRQVPPSMAAITTARRWADGWRSGLLGTCEFDLGFHPLWVQELMHLHDADAVLLVDPAAGLLDPLLVESLVRYAEAHPEPELCFMQAAPGLTGTLLRRPLVDRLTIANVHPGRLLTYFPDQHGPDPIGKPGCAPVPTPVARSTNRFKLDSDRQIARAQKTTAHLNGQLITSDAEQLVLAMRGSENADQLPREVVLELNTTRRSRPDFWPGKHLRIDRPEMTVETAERLFREIARWDDVRLILAGVGDPLLMGNVFQIIAAARSAGINAIGLETDLIATADTLGQLARSELDVVSVHFPAAHDVNYAQMMGADAFAHVFNNVAILEQQVKERGSGTPLISMLFTKTAANLAEMEVWYDYWLHRFGHAVIIGPSDYAGQMPDLAVADMSPQIRKPCNRLWSRMTVLSDGRVVSCEQDVCGKQTMGIVGETPIQEIWQQRFTPMRKCHQSGDWKSTALCGGCREWHR